MRIILGNQHTNYYLYKNFVKMNSEKGYLSELKMIRSNSEY